MSLLWPYPLSAPHPPTESGRKSNLKRKHTQTHTNKYRDSNNHKPRNLSHNFPKENKTDQQTRKAKLSVMMMLRLVWVSFQYFLLFFFFPGLVMNKDSGGLVQGNFFFGWLGVFFVCFGLFFLLLFLIFPRTRFCARLWPWVLSVPAERCERGKGRDRGSGPRG